MHVLTFVVAFLCSVRHCRRLTHASHDSSPNGKGCLSRHSLWKSHLIDAGGQGLASNPKYALRLLLFAVRPAHCHGAPPRIRSSRIVAQMTPGNKTFEAEARTAFDTFRTPAALIASSAYYGAFALQPVATDTFARGLAVRLHMLFAIGALSSQILCLIAATSGLEKLCRRPSTALDPHDSVDQFLRTNEFELEWYAVRANFFLGMLSFVVMVGLRAFLSFDAPAFGRVASGIVLFTLLVACHIVVDSEMMTCGKDPVFLRYFELLYARARKRKDLLFVALAVAALTSFMFFDGLIGLVRAHFAAQGARRWLGWLPFVRSQSPSWSDIPSTVADVAGAASAAATGK